MSSKIVKVAYADLQNAGDLFNKECVERYVGRKVVRSKIYDADMIAIGGALVGAQYSNSPKYRAAQRVLSVLYGKKPLYVWGSGFFRNDNERPFFRTNLRVCALRGELTKAKLERLTGKKYDVPLADAGLLISEFLPAKIEKKYAVGIVPHFWQIGEPTFVKMAETLPNARFIDIQRSAVEVATEIAECDAILSSSLHGLVFADSLHIPSTRLLGAKALDGGSFKFEDYYSSLGLKDAPWDLANGLPTLNDVYDAAKVDFALVDAKKEQLANSRPKFDD